MTVFYLFCDFRYIFENYPKNIKDEKVCRKKQLAFMINYMGLLNVCKYEQAASAKYNKKVPTVDDILLEFELDMEERGDSKIRDYYIKRREQHMRRKLKTTKTKTTKLKQNKTKTTKQKQY